MHQLKILIIFLSAIFSNSIFAAVCHPDVNQKLNQFIVGYGSLMQAASKDHTYPRTEKNIPVKVSGYQRAWIARGDSVGFDTTYLGVTHNNTSEFNGVVFKLSVMDSISHYDKREQGYCREEVPLAKIHELAQHTLSKGQYWIYVPMSIAAPSAKYPIVQSYVDIFLSGCLEIQEKYHLKNFANECITTTSGWSSYWENDRIYPRRPWIYQPRANEIDELLAEQKLSPHL